MATIFRKLPLYCFELTALTALLIVTVFLTAIGQEITWYSVTYTFKAMLNVVPMALLIGVFLYAAYHLIQHREIRTYARQILTPAWLILWLRLWIACWVVSFAYFWLKVYIPLINSNTWDQTFWDLDGILHFGRHPNVFVIEFFQGTGFVAWLDRWYHLWLYSVVFGMAFFAASSDELLRRRVMHSCVLLWALGVWVYLAFPAVGPIYVFEDVWKDIADSLPRAARAQALLWSNYQTVLELRAGEWSPFHHTLGVAALPSLHVAFHALFALWAWRHVRLLFIPFVLMTAATFIASVLTGWHYAIDGYVGIALAYLCYRLAIRLEQPQEPLINSSSRAERSGDAESSC